MAETVSHIADWSAGSMRGVIKKVTFAASSQTADVATGLKTVIAAWVQPINATYAKCRYNSTVAGTATNGYVAVESGVSANSYFVIAIGPS